MIILFIFLKIAESTNIANFEKTGEPSPSETHAKHNEHSRSGKVVSRTRSASLSIPVISMESYEREISLVGHTGRLPSVRKPSLPLMLMSGPLYVTNGTENPLKHTIVVEGNKVVESKTEKFCNLSEKDENQCNNNYDRKNEHLMRSGLLGTCNDPYCTTCPTYFKTSMQRLPNDSTVFDPQVIKYYLCL